MREETGLLDRVADAATQPVGSIEWVSRPAIVIFPDVGSMRRLIMRIVVVLPQPDGPTNTTVSPAGMVIDT